MAALDIDAVGELVERSPIGMALVDAEGRVVVSNRAFRDVIGESIDVAWLVPDTPTAVTRRVVYPDGRKGLARVRVVGDPDRGPTPGSLLVYAEPCDADASDGLTALLDRAADVIAVVDPRGAIVYVNETVNQVLRWTTSELIGKQALSYIHPSDLERAAAALVDALDEVETSVVEVRVRHRNGGYLWFEALTSGWIDAPDVKGVVLNLRESTGRHELAELATRRAELDRLVFDVSRQALDATLADVKEALPGILRHLGGLLEAHHAYVAQADTVRRHVTYITSWSAAGHPPTPAAGSTSALDDHNGVLAALERGELLTEADLLQRPPRWRDEWNRDRVQPARAVVLCPLLVGGHLLAVLGIEQDDEPRHWLHDELTAIRSVGEALAVALARDRDHLALTASEERFRLMAENASDVITLFDARARCLYASPSARTILGVRPDELVGTSLYIHLHSDDREAVRARFAEFAASTDDTVVLIYRWRCPDGRAVWLENVCRAWRDPETGIITSVQGSTRDITARKELEDELSRLALHDALTGVANRHLLIDRVGAAVRSQRRTGRPFAVIAMDLDGFKDLNDLYGHQTGDAALVVVAQRLLELVRANDTVGRLGGDEFVLLVEDATDNDALALAHRLVEAIGAPILAGDRWVKVGASVGVAPAGRDDETSVTALLHAADEAMYDAKRAGKGCVRLRRPV